MMINVEVLKVCLNVFSIAISTIAIVVCIAVCAAGKMPTDEELEQKYKNSKEESQ